MNGGNFEDHIENALDYAMTTIVKLNYIKKDFTKDATVGNVVRVLMELPQEKCNEVLCYAGFLLERIKNPDDSEIKKAKGSAK